jgi:hypothetical protein
MNFFVSFFGIIGLVELTFFVSQRIVTYYRKPTWNVLWIAPLVIGTILLIIEGITPSWDIVPLFKKEFIVYGTGMINPYLILFIGVMSISCWIYSCILRGTKTLIVSLIVSPVLFIILYGVSFSILESILQNVN